MTQPPTTNFDAAEILPGLATQVNRPQRYFAIALMTLSVLFSGIVTGVMIILYLEDAGPGYPQSTVMHDINEVLKKDPKNTALQTAVRNEDARIRQAFEVRRRRLNAGAWMLLIGLVVFAASARWYVSLDEVLPKPDKVAGQPGAAEPRVSPQARARIALAVIALALGGALLAFGPSLVPKAGKNVAMPPAVTFKDHWPSFRGPTGMGLVGAGNWPTEWDAATGRNILWKTALPLSGKGSPIVSGPMVFVTAADKNEQKVVCLDRATGRILWQTDVKSLQTVERRAKGPEGELTVFEDTGYAASTPVTDGRLVYALFATSDLAAVDFNGKLQWVKNFGGPQSTYGLSASLALAKDTIVFQFDQGGSADEKLSAIYGLDAKSGGTVWRTERPVSGSWCSPVVAATPRGPIVVASGVPWVAAYDAATGTELWRCGGMSGDVAPTPVYADGKVYVTSQGAKLMAIRADGQGDVTTTHVAWASEEEGLSDASSPLVSGGYFLQATSAGLVTCYDAAAGKLLWKHDFACAFWASPALAGDVVYLAGDDGKTRLFKLGAAFEPVRENALGEAIHASPAFGDGQMFIRGAKHLFCIAVKK